MNVWKYLTSKSYRRHRWAAINLSKYRSMPSWLWLRKIHRVVNKPLIMANLVEQRSTLPITWANISMAPLDAQSLIEND